MKVKNGFGTGLWEFLLTAEGTGRISLPENSFYHHSRGH
jgi:hypothetical protein